MGGGCDSAELKWGELVVVMCEIIFLKLCGTCLQGVIHLFSNMLKDFLSRRLCHASDSCYASHLMNLHVANSALY